MLNLKKHIIFRQLHWRSVNYYFFLGSYYFFLGEAVCVTRLNCVVRLVEFSKHYFSLKYSFDSP